MPNLFFKASLATLSILIPGTGLFFNGYRSLALIIQVALISLVTVFSWSRLILLPHGMAVLLTLVLLIQFISLIAFLYTRPKSKKHKNDENILLTILFIVLVFSVVSIGFTFKKNWLGIDIYFIPSYSMQPALTPGDYILIDTWLYTRERPKLGDVIIFKQESDSRILVKRVAYWPQTKGVEKNNQWYLLGDNRNYSTDSRYFGGVDTTQIQGKASIILYSSSRNSTFRAERFLKKID